MIGQSSECDKCRHAYVNKPGPVLQAGARCDAFPEGIPDEIFWGTVSHKKSYPGDHGIIFEPMEKSKTDARDYKKPLSKGAGN